MKNFENGVLVFRIWVFDGSSEVLAKHQYMTDATMFAEAKAAEDRLKRPTESHGWFYLVACESENEALAYWPIKPSARS